jgi:hypothetical protein
VQGQECGMVGRIPKTFQPEIRWKIPDGIQEQALIQLEL